VLSPLEHVPKRHKVSVGDKKLSSAPAPEQVPELQLFANLAIEEGAPPLSYWEGLYDQLKKVRCELDFPAIEELVFNCLVLWPKAMNQAEDGRLLSFDPPPLFCIGKCDIQARVLEEVQRVSMHPDLLAHQTKITKALHDLTQQNHKVGGNYAKFYMPPAVNLKQKQLHLTLLQLHLTLLQTRKPQKQRLRNLQRPQLEHQDELQLLHQLHQMQNEHHQLLVVAQHQQLVLGLGLKDLV
jgi:hypothetical protein